MRKSLFVFVLLGAMVLGGAALMTSESQAAPKCVDPNSCPIIVCPPGTEFVPTSCKECAHCEPINCRGKRPCETPL